MKPIFLITTGFILSYLWLLLPTRLFRPFPFKRALEVSLQFYYDYLLVRVCYIFFAYLLYEAYKTGQMKLVFFFFVGYAIDYLLIYNDPYAYLNSSGWHKTKPAGFFIPVSYSLIMGLTFIVLCIISFFRWRPTPSM